MTLIERTLKSNSESDYTEKIDYLWPVNREMRLINSGANIDKAIQANIKTFKQFAQSVA